MLHVKRTRAKGRWYYYFRTGQLNAEGTEILAPLPTPTDPGFGGRYAGLLSARTKREQMPSSAGLTVPALRRLYEKSPHFLTLSAATQVAYGLYLDHLCKMLPSAPAGAVERKDIVLLVDQYADRPGAANLLLKTVRALYKWGRVRGHVENEPCRDIEELPTGEHAPWPEHVLSAALEADNRRIRLSVHLLLYTAQRIGDVTRMKWTDIVTGDDGVRRIRVTQQKTKKGLLIRLHDKLVDELAFDQPRIGYILEGVRGQPLGVPTLRKDLQTFASTLGAKVVPHGLRKNAVNALLEAGCSVAEAASISGQCLQMVEHYAKARSQTKLGDSAVLKWQTDKR